jgi:hypothetical protein
MDFELPTLNRSLIIIRVKQPYVDWANQLADRDEAEKASPHTLTSMNEEPRAYLIPEIFDPDELEMYLERSWILIFEMLLSDWTSDQTLWPKKRTFKMFRDWFEIQCSSMVYDLWSKDRLKYTF